MMFIAQFFNRAANVFIFSAVNVVIIFYNKTIICIFFAVSSNFLISSNCKKLHFAISIVVLNRVFFSHYSHTNGF